MIDVYSVKASNLNDQKDFAGWAQHLKRWKSLFNPVPENSACGISIGRGVPHREPWRGGDSPKVVVANRVDPAGEKDAYKITFSELGWLLPIQVKPH